MHGEICDVFKIIKCKWCTIWEKNQ